jgi:pimeloyl-ACP methyl ester carboxylesterase
MQKSTALIGLLLAALLTGGCQPKVRHSGFLGGDHGATPLQLEYRGARPAIQISDPESISVIVYTHGNNSPRQRADCGKLSSQIPQSLRALQGDQILIYFYCSTAVDSSLDQRTAGNWIFRRAKELAAIVDELRAAGVPAQSIYLAGHSAGGWSALMAAREFGDQFNGVIAYAPAFAGPKSEEQRYPMWRREIRPRQIKHMLQAEQIRALVFAYEDDPLETPQDLSFLTDAYPDSLELIGYHCGAGHFTHIRDCKQEQATEAILRFIHGGQVE